MRRLYTLILYICTPLIVLRLFYCSLKLPAYRRRISERFGRVPKLEQAGGIWLHAVSLGESIAATPLIKALLANYPDTPLIITNMTPTGSNYIQKTFGNQVVNTYVPYDLPLVINRFIRHMQPRLVIIMETELWPNIFHCCAQHNLPIVIANARLSERSMRGYQKMGGLVKELLQHVTYLAAQSQADGERFIALGLTTPKLQVLGNIKFDLQLPDDLPLQAQQLRQDWGKNRPIWIAASTHDGEDEAILQAFIKVQQALPHALLILVSRHPERCNSVKALCRKQGLSYALRSEHAPLTENIQVVIGNTMGELKLLYAATDLAFVGGSLIPMGGHNILEPAAVGLPVLTGPHMHNFVEINQLLRQAGVAITINNSDELANKVIDLLNNHAMRIELGAKAKHLVEQNRGALANYLKLIETL